MDESGGSKMGKRMYLGLGMLALACAIAMPTGWAQSVPGETSRTPAPPAAHWRTPDFNALQSARLRYREMPVQRLFDVQKRNALRQMKAVQIGVGRQLNSEGTTLLAQPALSWRALAHGASARMEITSPDALAVRTGLQVASLHPDVELRFAGSDNPNRVVAVVTAGEAQRQLDAQGLYWTPSTDGQTQLIEIYRPAHVSASMARVGAPQLTHLLTNSRSDFKILEKIGESASCNVDTACRINELGERFVRAKNAVAHMVFIKSENGQTGAFICTGTLLNDTVTGTQAPYFYSAHHCISDQGTASTLNTFWRYEATGCNSGVSQTVTQLTRGATYLYSSSETDALLLLLAEPAPAGAEFSGWDAAALPASSAILGIHHPSGDAKKVSSGQQIPASSNATHNGVAWLSGSTEGGSSGSGLFTLHPEGYRLRGGLYGGDAACTNSGAINNAGNRDWYSRFDVAYPHIRQWLAPTTPIRMHGAQPLIPGQANAASARAMPTRAATQIKARPVFKRRPIYRHRTP